MQSKYIHIQYSLCFTQTLNKCIESRLQECTFLYIKISVWSGWGGERLFFKKNITKISK